MRKFIRSDLIAGFVTGIFSIPEGMAYAKLAGVNPAYGLYSGIIPTIAASMTTGTVLMISTLTSAIAISSHSVLNVAGFETSHDIARALFTLTFLIGVFMFLLGLLRLGSIVNYVSNSIMTGFILGASSLIIIGELGDLVGIEDSGGKKIERLIHWLTSFPNWDPITSSVGFGSIFLMLLLRKIPKIKEGASVLTLLIMTAIVLMFLPGQVRTVGDIAHIPSSFPSFVLPDIYLIPRLTLGAISVAIVALTQGASINSAVPNPSGHRANISRDFLAQGIGNLCGCFFQSMGTGGSLSRTGINVGSGAQSRFGGIFTGIWVALFVFTAGKYAEYAPLSVIGGILCVVAANIILTKLPDIKLIFRTSLASTILMLSTFISALFIHLQWTIFLGAALSFLYYIYSSTTDIRIFRIIINNQGELEEADLPKEFPSNEVTIIGFNGNNFFAEIPNIQDRFPSYKQTKNSVIIWRMRGREDAHSTYLKWLQVFSEELKANGNKLMIEGVEPHVMEHLKRTKILDVIGKDSVFPAHPTFGKSLQESYQAAKTFIKNIS